MERLNFIIRKAYPQKSPLARQAQAGLVVQFVNQKIKELWGQKAQAQARALHLKSGVLTVACQHAVMAQELRFKESRIKQMVAEKFPGNVLRKFKIITKTIEEECQEWYY